MAKRPENEEVTRGKCNCFMEMGTCYCHSKTTTRYVVRNEEGINQSQWETLDEALQDARNHLKSFRIWDSTTGKYIIKYGEGQ